MEISLLAVRPWVGYLTSLSLSFYIYILEIVIPYKIVVWIN